MRVVVQRVSRASVSVDGRVVGAIDQGLLVLVGFAEADGTETGEPAIEWMADKIVGLRVFADEAGRMNRDVRDVAGSVLVVSQFTLYGDVTRGRRPSFVHAANPDDAERLYDRFVRTLGSRGVPVATGEFGAMMDVELVNDGPVTVIIDR